MFKHSLLLNILYAALGDPIRNCCSAYLGTSQLRRDICLEEDKLINGKTVNNHEQAGPELNNQATL